MTVSYVKKCKTHGDLTADQCYSSKKHRSNGDEFIDYYCKICFQAIKDRPENKAKHAVIMREQYLNKKNNPNFSAQKKIGLAVTEINLLNKRLHKSLDLRKSMIDNYIEVCKKSIERSDLIIAEYERLIAEETEFKNKLLDTLKEERYKNSKYKL
jgi:hypothetical protein